MTETVTDPSLGDGPGKLLVTNTGPVLTMVKDGDDILGTQPGAAILCEEGLVTFVGPPGELTDEQRAGATVVDARSCAVMPGMIDCHTHLVWGGSRAHEFALRSKGASYAEIMAAGGGIRNTMGAVRSLDREDLVTLTRPRLDAMLRRGVTQVEAKSGYGLDAASEIKTLEAIASLNATHPIWLHPTCLAAHVVPPEFDDDIDGYVDVVVNEILPTAATEQLATAADVFIEKGAFTVEHGRRILTKAKDLGLKLHVHAEQLSWSGGAKLAAELSANSVGHLEFATEEDAKALADAGVIGEVLSTAQVFLGMAERVPGRMLAEAGVQLAVATDFNPGSANILDLHLAAGLAVTMGGLSADEALWGITRGGALALGQENAGHIAPGARADLAILRGPAAWDLVYAWGTDHVAKVIVCGELALDTA